MCARRAEVNSEDAPIYLIVEYTGLRSESEDPTKTRSESAESPSDADVGTVVRILVGEWPFAM